jgi:hypothetical protein
VQKRPQLVAIFAVSLYLSFNELFIAVKMWNYHLCCLAYGHSGDETLRERLEKLKSDSGIAAMRSKVVHYAVVCRHLPRFDNIRPLLGNEESSLAVLKFNSF